MDSNHPEHPHAADVYERETSDGGFSAGWGFHMKPSVRYWLDCHTHMREDPDPRAILAACATWHDTMWAHRLRRHVAVDGDHKNWQAFAAAAKADDRFLWCCRLTPDKPDVEHLERCKEAGAVALKLHNAPLIGDAMDPQVVISPDWHRVYHRAGELNMPIVWHVTQRLTDCPYTGGGRDSYWKIGRPRGANFSNADLLSAFLEAVAANRNTTFIGAHQLHLGPQRLTTLFAEHPNLVVDTSIGCFVAADDVMYPEDAARWREFVIAHDERILFGSDVVMSRQSAATELLRQHFLGHVRWVKQLNLPQESLSRVAHQNFERLAKLKPVEPFPWGALRP